MNRIGKLGLSCLALGTVAVLGGCVDDYGYGGVAVGYGAPGYDAYYDGYGDAGWYGEPGYGGYGFPGYYGWYGGFYYPGTGFYVYDRYHHPYRWNGDQRHYWQGQLHGYNGGAGYRGGANWGGFNRGAGGGARPSGQAFRGGSPGGGFHGGGGGGGHHR